MNNRCTQAEFFDRVCEDWDTVSRPDDKKIEFLLSKVALRPGDEVLDVGTGTGVLIPYISRLTNKAPIDAVDVSSGMIAVARRKFGDWKHVTFLEQDIESDVLNKRYDKIILYSVYPHLENKLETIGTLIKRNLKPNGKLMIAHAQSRIFLNDMHKRKDFREGQAALIPVQMQKFAFEEVGLQVTDARENDQFYYLVLADV